ncbi:hypothetical protein NBRC10512_007226 [Rhodotorula toruloides]|uniref:ATP synthase beta chain, mitochondrial n=1 Tax=Rhodotorula toruloides (strain NP11) TaxID=1130832 RepID=M7XYT9_RHOT1|nr:ATP synthase beta chain, mitochondrial precursor [Rhodotorula toruloides NP11]EMS25478.1 ATP synthase beta chain, mitochondrial precursor [Rhodotorula toruloides NP11]
MATLVDSLVARRDTQGVLFPPLNFAMVVPGARVPLRTPEQGQLPFLDTLTLKSIMYLSTDNYRNDTYTWARQKGWTSLHHEDTLEAVERPKGTRFRGEKASSAGLTAFEQGKDASAVVSARRPSTACPMTIERARKVQRFMSQPFAVAEVFTGIEGALVPLKKTVESFKSILAGEYDHLPENAFYMVGDIDSVVAKAEKLAAEMAEGN